MQLRDYQLEDVGLLLKRGAAGIFNEQRTGKTPTSIIAMQRKGVQRLLIVSPASMVYKWQEEYKTWTDKNAYVITSAKEFNTKDIDLNVDCIVINYENLRDNGKRDGCYAKLLKKYKPDGLIVDEAHRCKNRNSNNFLALKRFRRVPHRLYLTGTPAPNVPWEIWTLLNLIEPSVYTSYWNFIDEYFTKEINWAHPDHAEEPVDYRPGMKEQLQNILSELSIMRKRADVMPWLPKEEAPTIIKLPCTPSQTKYLKQLEDTFETEHVVTQSVLERLIRVRQICAAPAILRLRGSSPKLDWLKQYVTDYPEKSIVVFSNSKKFIMLVKDVVQCCVIVGDTNKAMREKNIRDFQSGVAKVIVIQTQAGKEGLTLDQADVTIFLDTFPPAADYLQAKDRMVSTSPDRVKPKEIIHLMMSGTYDEELYKLVEHNVGVTDVLNNYINYINERRNKNG